LPAGRDAAPSRGIGNGRIANRDRTCPSSQARHPSDLQSPVLTNEKNVELIPSLIDGDQLTSRLADPFGANLVCKYKLRALQWVEYEGA
jgi:hypothetical protein